ncbi:MAG TPA: FHA domain-containing protein [Patescibacteria group bacterium]|jgi:hypothetical protein|nr:FHA domain-containing protein [Patescibacteria group bacterium]
MNRSAQLALACPDCKAHLKLDERLSGKATRLVYACKPCGTLWSLNPRDKQLVQEQSLSDSATGTIRMRVVKPGAPGAGGKPAGADLTAMPEGITVALEVTDGPARGQVYHLDRRLVVIGREEGEVQLADPMISRRHASLEIHDLETIILRDLSSTNGTYHNDQLIAFCKLEDGDEIRLGSTILTVAVDLLG